MSRPGRSRRAQERELRDGGGRARDVWELAHRRSSSEIRRRAAEDDTAAKFAGELRRVTQQRRVGEWGWAVALLPMSDRTLVLLKPDAVERKLVGQIVSRFEAKNLSVVALDLRSLDADTLARHYEEHVGKGFYAELVEFMSRGPVVAMVIEGPQDSWEVVRTMMGATNPRKAAPGTIRGDLGILFTENLVHGSDSLESATREIGIFFPNL